MFAKKIITETDHTGKVKNMPLLPPNKQFEIIILDLNETKAIRGKNKREPHPDLKGKVKILGDVINTTSQDMWDLPT
ncbi:MULTISPECIES: hypothetical protein [Desulfobacter]|jgi:hypothetical protein|uniref:Uncharacterized protein n=1 Tax=Desulfobacter postgatei 2ac9 TaxID=879212 RepID=I5B278_9BACT|nr:MULTISPECIES: hypothetical protein [Desulfobacter]EIM63591.1 hypothetical protein DespoDRAFT_01671 [Desulfobacter postgatei 2ac9]